MLKKEESSRTTCKFQPIKTHVLAPSLNEKDTYNEIKTIQAFKFWDKMSQRPESQKPNTCMLPLKMNKTMHNKDPAN